MKTLKREDREVLLEIAKKWDKKGIAIKIFCIGHTLLERNIKGNSGGYICPHCGQEWEVK